ncbi:YciI family protein [Streptomyces sp. SBT349]|uniref:YciI family protein n=1 Tax=Streptomyces sp. SBT349 TaxID=1580539 RepID=UPI00066E0C49|nr:YciI family protein [Streptomyces sp. SBT349]
MLIVELAFTLPATEERLAGRPAHRASLARLHEEGRLLAAGPWADESGALLVFDLPGPEELDRVLAADPYFHRTPGVTVVSVREWAPVVVPGPDGRWSPTL